MQATRSYFSSLAFHAGMPCQWRIFKMFASSVVVSYTYIQVEVAETHVHTASTSSAFLSAQAQEVPAQPLIILNTCTEDSWPNYQTPYTTLKTCAELTFNMYEPRDPLVELASSSQRRPPRRVCAPIARPRHIAPLPATGQHRQALVRRHRDRSTPSSFHAYARPSRPPSAPDPAKYTLDHPSIRTARSLFE